MLDPTLPAKTLLNTVEYYGFVTEELPDRRYKISTLPIGYRPSFSVSDIILTDHIKDAKWFPATTAVPKAVKRWMDKLATMGISSTIFPCPSNSRLMGLMVLDDFGDWFYLHDAKAAPEDCHLTDWFLDDGRNCNLKEPCISRTKKECGFGWVEVNSFRDVSTRDLYALFSKKNGEETPVKFRDKEAVHRAINLMDWFKLHDLSVTVAPEGVLVSDSITISREEVRPVSLILDFYGFYEPVDKCKTIDDDDIAEFEKLRTDATEECMEYLKTTKQL